jgi:hypothetical protein
MHLRVVTSLLLVGLAGCGAAEEITAEPVLAPLSCGAYEAMAEPVVLGEAMLGTTEGASESRPKEPSCGTGDGPEAIYYVEVDHKVDILWEVVPDFDGVAYIRSSCDGTDDAGALERELACADEAPTLNVESAVYQGADAGTYFLVVDGVTAEDAGDYTATARLREVMDEGEECDTEGVLSRCKRGLGCNPETLTCTQELDCTNITDDDGDGFIDCEDADQCHQDDVCLPGDGLTGDACLDPSDCFANANDPFCWDEVQLGYPGGSCSEFCNLGADDCGLVGTCVDFNLPSGNGLCLQVCASSEECPENYACTLPMMATQPRCTPACTADDQCVTTGFCNDDVGSCAVEDEECADGFDNDGDDRVDCADLDCAADSACMTAIVDACDVAVELVDTVSGDSSTGNSLMSATCTGTGGAKESLHTYLPLADGAVVLTLASATDQGIYVRTECGVPQSEAGCVDAAAGGDLENLVLPVEADMPLTVVVDGFQSAAESGPYTLDATFVALDEQEENGDAAAANVYVDPFVGSIDPAGDEDWIAVTVDEAAISLDVAVSGLRDECFLRMLDSELEIISPDGSSQLAFNDDIAQVNYCSQASMSAPEAGTYYVRVASSVEFDPMGTFVYEVTATVTY